VPPTTLTESGWYGSWKKHLERGEKKEKKKMVTIAKYFYLLALLGSD